MLLLIKKKNTALSFKLTQAIQGIQPKSFIKKKGEKRTKATSKEYQLKIVLRSPFGRTHLHLLLESCRKRSHLNLRAHSKPSIGHGGGTTWFQDPLSKKQFKLYLNGWRNLRLAFFSPRLGHCYFLQISHCLQKMSLKMFNFKGGEKNYTPFYLSLSQTSLFLYDNMSPQFSLVKIHPRATSW